MFYDALHFQCENCQENYKAIPFEAICLVCGGHVSVVFDGKDPVEDPELVYGHEDYDEVHDRNN